MYAETSLICKEEIAAVAERMLHYKHGQDQHFLTKRDSCLWEILERVYLSQRNIFKLFSLFSTLGKNFNRQYVSKTTKWKGLSYKKAGAWIIISPKDAILFHTEGWWRLFFYPWKYTFEYTGSPHLTTAMFSDHWKLQQHWKVTLRPLQCLCSHVVEI